jgi:NADH:ubiquinone oxidoreductase subunit E
MGSSCFSRGNNRNIEVIQEHLGGLRSDSLIELKGHLCEGRCRTGPNLRIDDTVYGSVDPVTLVGLLRNHLNPGRL